MLDNAERYTATELSTEAARLAEVLVRPGDVSNETVEALFALANASAFSPSREGNRKGSYR